MSNAEIGRIVNLTRAAVRERIQSLIEKGVIDRFTVIMNPRRAGTAVSLFLEVAVDWVYMERVVDFLLADNSVTNVYQMSGTPHLHVHALFDEQADVEGFLKDLASVKGITDVKSEFIMRRFKERGSLLI